MKKQTKILTEPEVTYSIFYLKTNTVAKLCQYSSLFSSLPLVPKEVESFLSHLLPKQSNTATCLEDWRCNYLGLGSIMGMIILEFLDAVS